MWVIIDSWVSEHLGFAVDPNGETLYFDTWQEAHAHGVEYLQVYKILNLEEMRGAP